MKYSLSLIKFGHLLTCRNDPVKTAERNAKSHLEIWPMNQVFVTKS